MTKSIPNRKPFPMQIPRRPVALRQGTQYWIHLPNARHPRDVVSLVAHQGRDVPFQFLVHDAAAAARTQRQLYEGHRVIDRDDDGVPEVAQRWDIERWWRSTDDTPVGVESSGLKVIQPPVDPDPLEVVSL